MQQLIISALFIFGVKFLFTEGQLLDKFVKRISNIIFIDHWVFKPIFICPPCMSSFWGTIMYLILDVQLNYLVFVISLAGLNALLINFWKF